MFTTSYFKASVNISLKTILISQSPRAFLFPHSSHNGPLHKRTCAVSCILSSQAKVTSRKSPQASRRSQDTVWRPRPEMKNHKKNIFDLIKYRYLNPYQPWSSPLHQACLQELLKTPPPPLQHHIVTDTTSSETFYKITQTGFIKCLHRSHALKYHILMETLTKLMTSFLYLFSLFACLTSWKYCHSFYATARAYNYVIPQTV